MRWVRLGSAGLKAIDFRKSLLAKELSQYLVVPDGERRASGPGMIPGASVADGGQIRAIMSFFGDAPGPGRDGGGYSG
jgi:hypothetical protein